MKKYDFLWLLTIEKILLSVSIHHQMRVSLAGILGKITTLGLMFKSDYLD